MTIDDRKPQPQPTPAKPDEQPTDVNATPRERKKQQRLIEEPEAPTPSYYDL